jgi:squalene-hopene/tetraprenyl-beta-curcumene cyclase
MRRFLVSFFAAGLIVSSAVRCVARDMTADKASELAKRGIGFLESAQGADGSFSPEAGPGVTALAAAGMLANGRTPVDPTVARALAYVEKHVHPDGGIYAEDSLHRNYETCVAMLCFSRANADGRYDELLKRAEAYVKKVQWDEDEGLDAASLSYGGAGYGSHSRPDLSNTSFLLEALQAVGASQDDPAVQRALIFVSRCQNLETEYNQTEFPSKNPDGGFYYTIAAGGSSQAGTTDEGGLRSYGSMTYAGLKSMIYAGVDRNDERVEAALEWIAKNYSVEQNPGMGETGLYYYYHTFAKALSVVGEDSLVDAEGVKHDWRQDLVNELAKRQQSNGSWSNLAERWLEGDPNLVTGYVLLALSYCR